MAITRNEVNLNQDAEDQAELDKAYNEMMGVTSEQKDNIESEVQEDVAEADVDDLDASENDINDDSSDHDLDFLEDHESDELDGSVDPDDELVDDLDTLEDEGVHKDAKVKLDPEAQKVVDKRIGRELKRLRDSQRETADLKAQVAMLTQLMTGGAQQVPQQQYQAQSQFVPPMPTKPYEEMSDLEKVGYGIQIHQAQQDQVQREAVARKEMQAQAFEYQKVMSALNQHQGDKAIHEIIHSPNGENAFTKHMAIGLSDYKNVASIMKNLHLTKKTELLRLQALPPAKQAAGVVKLAEQYNAQRLAEHNKKISAKKPTPPGKLSKASLPNKTAGNKDIYSGEFLEGLTNDQYSKLLASGR